LTIFLLVLIGVFLAENLLFTNRSEEVLGAEVQVIPPLPQSPETLKPKPGELIVPILIYHHIRVNPRPKDREWVVLHISPTMFENQLRYLSDHGFNSISLDQLADALDGKISLPAKPVILTFDDGYESFYQNAFPLLIKYGVRAIDFIITKRVDTLPAYLTWRQIIEMNQSEFIGFGAHTRTHPSLVRSFSDRLIDEVRGSKEDLENRLGKQVHWFAYPYGDFNDRVVDTVKAAGYTGAVSTIYSSVHSKGNIFILPRVMVSGRFSLDTFAKRLGE